MKSLVIKCSQLLFCFIFIFFKVEAQNLIPNPSFENRSACYLDYTNFPPNNPNGPGYGSFEPYPAEPTAKKWYNHVIGSVDYYNVCAYTALGDSRHVPDNFQGYQYPHTGNAYAGAIIWYESLIGNEYFSSRLSSPLIAGHQYHLSFWVSLAETSRIITVGQRQSIYGVNSIGAHFSQNEIVHDSTTIVLSNLSADIVSNPNVFYTDTVNWQKVEGTYTAVGGEEWMTIGNFTAKAAQQKVLVEEVLGSSGLSYYYFDDFCLKDVASATKNSLNKTNCDSTSISGNISGTMWTWSTGDTSRTITVTQSGTYWVQSFANCQIYVDTFHVTIPPKGIPFDLGDDISHCGDTTIVLGPTDSTFSSYLWSNGSTSKNITINSSGTYYVKASTSCNTYSDTIHIAINPIPPAPKGFDTAMCRQPIVSYQVPVQGQNLLWFDMSTGVYSTTQPPVDLTQDKDFDFRIFNVSGAGCISDPAIVQLLVHGEMPEISLEDTATCMSSVNLGIDLGDVNYRWSTGEKSCCIKVSETGIYTLTVTNQCGSSTAKSKVNIMHCNHCLDIPNAFSPNGDALNDEFKIQNACLLGRFEISVYNRYGQRVYHSEDVSKGWDGNFNGKQCDLGTYYYYLSADPSFESRQIILKGNIELLR